MSMYHVFSHRLLNALLRGCPALCRHLHCDSDKAFHARQVVCAVISWGLSYCSFTPLGAWKWQKGGQPLEWQVRKHFLLIGEWMSYVPLQEITTATFTYVIITSKFMITPLWTSGHQYTPLQSELWAFPPSAGPRIDCYGRAGKSSSGLLLHLSVCACVCQGAAWGTCVWGLVE